MIGNAKYSSWVGFGAKHPAGANFAFGDGTRFRQQLTDFLQRKFVKYSDSNPFWIPRRKIPPQKVIICRGAIRRNRDNIRRHKVIDEDFFL